MGVLATKKAVAQLQKIFDFLGEYGGVIETNNPENWWTLDLEVESVEDSTKSVQIGIYTLKNGDATFDPLFHLILTMDKDKITSATIIDCEELSFQGVARVGEDDIIRGPGFQEKDQYGLSTRFSNFMDNMTNNGPYLTNPKSVKHYNKTLAD